MRVRIIGLIAIVLTMCNMAMAAPKAGTIDSLEQAANNTDLHDTLRLQALKTLLPKLYYSHTDKCIAYEGLGLQLAQTTNDIFSEAYIFNSVGIAHAIKLQYDSAAVYFQQAVAIHKEHNNPKSLDQYLTNMGIIYRSAGDYEKAMNTFIEAVQLADSMKNDIGKSKAYFNMAHTFFEMKNYEKALENWRIAETLTGDTTSLATNWESQGACYEAMDSIPQALELYNKAAKVYRSKNRLHHLANLEHNMSFLHYRQKNYNQTIEHAQNSVKFYDQLNQSAAKFNPYLALSRSYAQLNDYAMAEKYLNEAGKIAKEVNTAEFRQKFYEDSWLLYSEKGNYRQAYDYLKKHFDLKDSVLNEERIKAVQEMETKYETEKKEKENQLLAAENDLHKAEIRSKNTLLITAMVMFVLVLLIATIFYIMRSRTIKHRHQMQLSNMKIDAQEETMKEISSLLHTDMGSQISALLLNIQAKDKDKILQNETKALQDIYARLRQLSHLLALPTFIQSSIDQEINLLTSTIKTENLQIDSEVYSKTGWSDVSPKLQQNIYRIAQELLNNSMKHAKADHIDLQIVRTPGQINLTYEDNGKGYNPDEIKKNIGYKNEIEERTRAMNGQLSDDSRAGHGAALTFSFPIKS